MPLTLLRHATQKPPIGPLKLDIGHPLSQGLLAYFPLNEVGSKAVNNAIAQGVAGKLAGTAAWGSGNGPGVLVPGTTSNFVDCGNWPAINNLANSGAFSISVMCRRDTVATLQTVISKSSGASANGWFLGWGISGTNAQIGFEYPRVTTSMRALSTAVYGTTGEYALLASWDGVGVPHFYVNGVEAPYATQRVGAGAFTTEGTASLALGQLTDNFWPFNGLIYNAAIWNRPLSAADALNLTAEPYAMFQTRPMQRWFVIPAAGGFTPKARRSLNYFGNRVGGRQMLRSA